MSVVFVDVVGSTALAEGADPEDLKEALGRIFRPVREQAALHGGTVEKFIGDAAVVVFGAPTAHGDDSERAVRCALGIVEAVAADPGIGLQVRAGVSTGEALVELGSAYERGEALATGDVMSSAARLQGAAPPGRVAVGPGTFAATRRRIVYEPLGNLELKGIAGRVPAWLAVRPVNGAAEAGAPVTPLVGRVRELGLLEAALDRALAGREPAFVTIAGEPGIGKSRLASEFGRRAEAAGARRVVGRCAAFDRSAGYPATVQQVETLAGVLESDPPEVAAARLREMVARHLPKDEVADVARYLSLLLGLGVEPPAAARQPLFYAVRRLFESIAAAEPLLLVIEDLHWAGPSQVELLGYLRENLRAVPVLTLATTRPGEPAEDAIQLEPLGVEDSASVLAALLPEAEPGRRERLVEAAAGNPLFLEELATSPAASGAGSLPATVREAIAARLDALPPVPRALVLDASVVGQSFWRNVLAEIEGGRDLDAGIAELVEAGVVRPLDQSRLAGDREFAFKHGLVREVAYETLPRAARRVRHLAVARHLESVAAAPARDLAAVLAHHWRLGGESGKAIDNLLLAARLAGDAWAEQECAAHFEEALELAQGDATRHLEVRLRQGESLVQLSDFRAGATILDEVLPQLLGKAQVEALIARARVAYWLEDVDETRHFSDRARELAEALGDGGLAAAAMVYQVATRYFDGRLGEAVEIADEANRRWEPGTRPIDLAELHEFRADVSYWLGRYPEAEQEARSAHGLGGEVRSIEPVLRAGGWQGLAMAAQGRSEEALEWLDGILQRARELDSRWGAASLNYSSLAWRDMQMFEEARQRNRAALELVARRGAYGMPEMEAEIDLLLTDLAEHDPGRVQAALPALWSEAINGRAWRPWLGGLRLALVRAELARQVEGPAEAAAAAEDTIARARRVGRVKYEAAGAEILGTSLLGLGRRDEALAELRRAVALADRLGSPTARWQFRVSLRGALLATGDERGAEGVHREGAEIIRAYAATLKPAHAAHFLAAEPVREAIDPR